MLILRTRRWKHSGFLFVFLNINEHRCRYKNASKRQMFMANSKYISMNDKFDITDEYLKQFFIYQSLINFGDYNKILTFPYVLNYIYLRLT